MMKPKIELLHARAYGAEGFRLGSIASYWPSAIHFRSTRTTGFIRPAPLVRLVPKAVGAGPTNSHVENVHWQAC
jgi:hypothetical protein